MSRVKTFQDKQRSLSEAEIKALEHLHAKKAGVKLKEDQVIDPEHAHLKDDTFEADREREDPLYGKVITEEDLEKEKKKEKEDVVKYGEEFHKQFEEWKKVDHHSEYEWCSFDHEDYLVRLFDMDVSMFPQYKTIKQEWSSILNQFKIKDTQLEQVVFPIVKILSVGEAVKDAKYKVGDIVLVPSCDVVGDDWNPHFITFVQTQKSQGMKPVLPDGMPQRVPNVEKNWAKYNFVRPWVPRLEAQDRLTFLIPSPKVKGTYHR